MLSRRGRVVSLRGRVVTRRGSWWRYWVAGEHPGGAVSRRRWWQRWGDGE